MSRPLPLSLILEGATILQRAGLHDPLIEGIAYDSRKVRPGFLFVALPGLHADGHGFIGQAIKAGAAAVLCERIPPSKPDGVACIMVPDSRTAMSRAAAVFNGHPSRSLRVIGVTGTEGKSSTVYFIWQLLNLSGRKAGFFSTVMSDSGHGEVPNPEHQTTPESTAVQGMLADMRDSDCGYAVVESSSHGLSHRTARLADVLFDVGVMTNVTHEHLEFHGTWENYRSDKANLFRALGAHDHRKIVAGGSGAVPSAGIACADDPSWPYFRDAAAGIPFISYSARGAEADLRALSIAAEGNSLTFIAAGADASGAPLRLPARLNLPGDFNVANALAACLAAAAASGTHWSEFIPLLPSLRPVRGRMSRVDCGQPFDVLIDYAHTPSSFATVLPQLRKAARGKLICVFGSGGERDREKRPLQGSIAAANCDTVILADEDPRGEDPMALLEEIAVGCAGMRRGESLLLIPDRHEAIARAFSLARPGDMVVLLGKGHENSIIHAEGSMPYDEESAARKALAALGFHAAPGAKEQP